MRSPTKRDWIEFDAYAVQRRNAAHRNIEDKYYELLMAVGKKFLGETRHETALRYIREREKPSRIYHDYKEDDDDTGCPTD